MTVSSELAPYELALMPENAAGTLSDVPARTSTLYLEFAGRVSDEVIDRTLDVAKHVLERSHTHATVEAIETLARECLQNRPAARR
jgi:hypothetical protein